MAQYNITIDSELLHQLFLSDSKESGVSKLLESVLNQILQAQATEQLRAKAYERTDEGLGYRNDTYHRMLTMREEFYITVAVERYHRRLLEDD